MLYSLFFSILKKTLPMLNVRLIVLLCTYSQLTFIWMFFDFMKGVFKYRIVLSTIFGWLCYITFMSPLTSSMCDYISLLFMSSWVDEYIVHVSLFRGIEFTSYRGLHTKVDPEVTPPCTYMVTRITQLVFQVFVGKRIVCFCLPVMYRSLL